MSNLGALWQRQVAQFIQRTSTRATRPSPSRLSPLFQSNQRILTRRFQSGRPNFNSKPPNPNPNPNPNPTSKGAETRLSRLLTRFSRFLPQRLRTSLQDLRSAPLSHIGAFLLLHEVTAIASIFGLTLLFHAFDWVPTSWVVGPWAAWAEDGLKKYVPYFRRKQWFGLKGRDENGNKTPGGGDADGEDVLEGELRDEVKKEKEREGREGKRKWFSSWKRKREMDDAAVDSTHGAPSEGTTTTDEGRGSKKAAVVWQKVNQAATNTQQKVKQTATYTDKGYRIGIQIAAAYTITKFLLVPRIALSLWLTPWLARGLVGVRRAVWK